MKYLPPFVNIVQEKEYIPSTSAVNIPYVTLCTFPSFNETSESSKITISSCFMFYMVLVSEDWKTMMSVLTMINEKKMYIKIILDISI